MLMKLFWLRSSSPGTIISSPNTRNTTLALSRVPAKPAMTPPRGIMHVTIMLDNAPTRPSICCGVTSIVYVDIGVLTNEMAKPMPKLNKAAAYSGLWANKGGTYRRL